MFDGDLDIPCPECGHETSISVGELQTNADPHVICGGCGKTIRIDADDLRDKLSEIQKSLDDLNKKPGSRMGSRKVRSASRRLSKSEFGTNTIAWVGFMPCMYRS